ncbi:efflux RND transporter periplasmic adaptor subunit [bacterium]|nr:efflux RND transporter periplasmic adaptor subunit [bacterium]
MNSYKIITLTAASILWLAALGCTQAEKPAELQRQSFAAPVVTVSARTETGYTEVTGTVTGTTAVPIATKLFSAITYLGFEEGERVSAGDVLARIDDTDIQAMRNEAAAYQAEAAAALGEVETVVAQGQAGLAQAQAALAQAEAAHADAQVDFERAERLVAEDSIPRVNRDKAELGLKIAAENVERAKGAVAQAEGMIAQAEAKRPQVAAKQQQAAAKGQQAASYQQYATLTAPFDGVVTRKLAEVGQMASPGYPIYMVEDDSSYRVELSVAEHLLKHLTAGETVEVIVGDEVSGLSVITGTIDVIGAAANPGTHTVKVELQLDSSDGLFSGRFVRVRIPAGEQERLSVPAAAVFVDGEQSYVWRVSENGVISRTAVELGPEEDGVRTVIRGLSDGDRIVAQPQTGMYSGAQVGN